MSKNTKSFKKTPIALLAIAALTGSTAVLAEDVTASQARAGAASNSAIDYNFIAIPITDTNSTLTITTEDATNQFIGAITQNTGLLTTKTIKIDGKEVTIASIGNNTTSVSALTVTNGATTVSNGLYATTISLADDLVLSAGDVKGSIAFAADKTLTLNENANTTVTSAITTNTTEQGSIIIKNQGTFDNNIGASDKLLNKITNAAGNSIFKGDVFVKTFENTAGNTKFEKSIKVNSFIHTAGELDFDDTFEATEAVTFNDNSSFAGATTKFNKDATIADGKTLLFDANTAVTGAIDGSGSINILSETNFNSKIGENTPLTAINIGSNTTDAVAVFNESVNAKNITITAKSGSDSSAEFKKTIAGDIALVNSDTNDATVSFSTHSQNITGTITTNSAGHGNLTTKAGGHITFKSQVGSADLYLGTIYSQTADIFEKDVYANVIRTPSSDTTFNGNLWTKNPIDANSSHNIYFNGITAQTITGPIEAFTVIVGTADNPESNVTFKNKITGSADIYATALFQDDVTGSITAKATTDTKNTTANITLNGRVGGTVELIAGSSLTITSQSLGDGSTAVIAGTLTSVDGAKIYLPTSLSLTDGTATIKLATTAGGLNNSQLVSNTLLTYTTTNGKDVIASAKTAAQIATTLGSTAQVGTSLQLANTAINDLPGTTEAELALKASLQAKFSTALNTGGSTALKVAEQVAIQTDMLASTADNAKQTGSTVFSVAANRLASVRGGSQFSGIATGDMAAVNGIWARTFGNWTEQDTHDGSAGFEADTYGVAFGFDKEIIDNTRLGVLLSYAATDVDGKGAGSFQNDIDSYQFSLYGDYTLDTYYVEGMLGYATNKNKTSHIALGSTITANYDSNQWMARIGAGIPYMISENMYVTPNALLAYTHISTDNYTEKGDLSKYVQIDDIDSLVGSLDIKAHTNIETKTGDTFTPIVHAGVSYEFGDNNVSSTGNFVGQTNKFTMQSADSEELSGVFGAGVDYTTGQLTISAKYDATLNADSRSHNASLEARFEF